MDEYHQAITGSGVSLCEFYNDRELEMITEEQRDELLTLIVGTLGAAPNAYLMKQLEDGLENGIPISQYASILVQSDEFIGLYGSIDDFTAQLFGTSVSESAIADANDYITNALMNGSSIGDVVLNSLKAISTVEAGDPIWGGAAKRLTNKTDVAEHYIEQTADTLASPESVDFESMRSLLQSVTEDDSSVEIAKAEIEESVALLAEPEEVVTTPDTSFSNPSPAPVSKTVFQLIEDYIAFNQNEVPDILRTAAIADLASDFDHEDIIEVDSEGYQDAVENYDIDDFFEEVELTDTEVLNDIGSESLLASHRAQTLGQLKPDSLLSDLDGYSSDTILTDEAVEKLFDDVNTLIENSTVKYTIQGEIVLDKNGVLADSFEKVYLSNDEYSNQGSESDFKGYIHKPFLAEILEKSIQDREVGDFSDDYSPLMASYSKGSIDYDLNDGSYRPDIIELYIDDNLSGTLSIAGKDFSVTDGVIDGFPNDDNYLIIGAEGAQWLIDGGYPFNYYSIDGTMISNGDTATPADLSNLEVLFTPDFDEYSIITPSELYTVDQLQEIMIVADETLDTHKDQYGENIELFKDLYNAIVTLDLDNEYNLSNVVSYDSNVDVDFVKQHYEIGQDQNARMIFEYLNDYGLREAIKDDYPDLYQLLEVAVERDNRLDADHFTSIYFLNTDEGKLHEDALWILRDRDSLKESSEASQLDYELNKEYVDLFWGLSAKLVAATYEIKKTYADILILDDDYEADVEANVSTLFIYDSDTVSTIDVTNFGSYVDLYVNEHAQAYFSNNAAEDLKSAITDFATLSQWVQTYEKGDDSALDVFIYDSGEGTVLLIEKEVSVNAKSELSIDDFDVITLVGVEADQLEYSDSFFSIS